MTKDDLLKTLKQKFSSKVGIDALVDDILARQTHIKDGVLKWNY